MKEIKSEKGMILVTVLMLIVIFSVVGLVIFNFSVTNAKQTSNIEKDMQSVDIAEMGVIRYRSELLVKMNDVLTKDIVKAIQAIEATNAEIANSNAENKVFIPINSDTVIEKMVGQGAFSNPLKFHLGYSLDKKHLIASHPNYAYTIVEEPIDTTAPGFPRLIKLKMKSKGYSVDDSSEISAEFSYNIIDIIDSHLTPGTMIEVEKSSPVLIEKPVLELLVNGRNLQEVDCNTSWLKNRCNNNAENTEINGHIEGEEGTLSGDVKLLQGDINVSTSKLYLKSGSLTVGTVENITNSKLHSSGDITFNNSNKGGFTETEISGKDITFGTIKVFNNNKLYAEGTIEFDNINTSSNKKWMRGGINNSVIYSTGNIIFDNLNEGFNHSSVHAGGNLEFKHLNGQSHINNTKIRVYGDLKVDVINTLIQNSSIIWVDGDIITRNVNGQAIDSTSFICAKGKIDNNLLNKALVVGKDAYGNNIKNIQANVNSFENCGKVIQKVNESKPSTLEPILSSLEKALDEAKYSYE